MFCHHNNAVQLGLAFANHTFQIIISAADHISQHFHGVAVWLLVTVQKIQQISTRCIQHRQQFRQRGHIQRHHFLLQLLRQWCQVLFVKIVFQVVADLLLDRFHHGAAGIDLFAVMRQHRRSVNGLAIQRSQLFLQALRCRLVKSAVGGCLCLFRQRLCWRVGLCQKRQCIADLRHRSITTCCQRAVDMLQQALYHPVFAPGFLLLLG